jgi:predicted lipoprotein with Yx(FWY)xxD motif
MGRWRITMSALLVGALLVGACGDDDTDADSPEGTGATETTEPGPDEPGLVLGATALGEVLVDGESGLTAYLFTDDTPTSSACVGTCEGAWPPIAGPLEVGDGLDESLVATLTRPDGSEQVTYNGHPLYLYSGDAEAGDVTGQGAGGKWFVVNAAGEPVEDAPPPSRGY